MRCLVLGVALLTVAFGGCADPKPGTDAGDSLGSTSTGPVAAVNTPPPWLTWRPTS